ncbi:hypothetical protein LSTR_LSTR015726 [Laodelphax striatellus]|uniref:Uncharacterized protein n=1 Tax=Laodelphax striatellus TaxID=195883 RepID=A0A482WK80_LAOST|nr:hypothetical protein LSTR_LSTR015726 [Laodelphax striatellus]
MASLSGGNSMRGARSVRRSAQSPLEAVETDSDHASDISSSIRQLVYVKVGFHYCDKVPQRSPTQRCQMQLMKNPTIYRLVGIFHQLHWQRWVGLRCGTLSQ